MVIIMKQINFDISDLRMTIPEVLFGILQCEFLSKKQIGRYSNEYYADGDWDRRKEWITNKQTAYYQDFYDYKSFVSNWGKNLVYATTCDNTYYCYVEGEIDKEPVKIIYYYSGNILEINYISTEVYSLLIDYIKGMTSEIVNKHRIESYCSEYMEFANLLREIKGFYMNDNDMLNHINAAYVMNGIPKEYIKTRIAEWTKLDSKRSEKIKLWKELAKEKNLNELSWQIMNDVREQITYDNRFNKLLDIPMFDFLIEKNKKLYEEGKLDNFILLNKNDKKIAPTWIFALYSELKRDVV